MKTMLISIAVAVVLNFVTKFIVEIWAENNKFDAYFEKYPVWIHLMVAVVVISQIVAVVFIFIFLFNL